MSTDNAPDEYVFWFYSPSIAGGVIAALLFGTVTILHAWRLVRTRLWFCIPFVAGGLFETIGYAARAAAHNQQTELGPYLIQSLLILLAPILFAASVYMILARLILACQTPSLSIIRVNWVTKLFVTGDVLCFFVQGGGGGIMAKAETQDQVQTGENIVLGGLVLQILVFVLFVSVAGVWHWRMLREGRQGFQGWEKYTWVLYAVSGLIAVRNVARCVEYGMGRDSYLYQNEWCLYVYDFLLMFLCLTASLLWYKLDMKQLLQGQGTGGDMLPLHSGDNKGGRMHGVRA